MIPCSFWKSIKTHSSSVPESISGPETSLSERDLVTRHSLSGKGSRELAVRPIWWRTGSACTSILTQLKITTRAKYERSICLVPLASERGSLDQHTVILVEGDAAPLVLREREIDEEKERERKRGREKERKRARDQESKRARERDIKREYVTWHLCENIYARVICKMLRELSEAAQSIIEEFYG